MSQFDGIDGKYFYYFFSHNFSKVVSKYTAKTSVDSVRMNMITDMPIYLPPLPEQQAIAEVLTTADREIELLKKELEQQKLIKKYLMQQLLTGKIRVKEAIK
jgi:type I restriction enzyme S subunit